MVFVKCIPLGGVSQSEVLVFFVKPAISFFCREREEGWVNAIAPSQRVDKSDTERV
jgi:hypothetical protein